MFKSKKDKKIMYTSVNPNFTIKVGCKGVYITRTWYNDGRALTILNKVRKSNMLCPCMAYWFETGCRYSLECVSSDI